MLFFLPIVNVNLFCSEFTLLSIVNFFRLKLKLMIHNSYIHFYTLIPVLILALLALEFSSISLSSGMIALLFTSSNAFL